LEDIFEEMAKEDQRSLARELRADAQADLMGLNTVDAKQILAEARSARSEAAEAVRMAMPCHELLQALERQEVPETLLNAISREVQSAIGVESEHMLHTIRRSIVDEMAATTRQRAEALAAALRSVGGAWQASYPSSSSSAPLAAKPPAVVEMLSVGSKEEESLRVTFGPGPIGATLHSVSGKVTSVLDGGQAQLAGVQVGMTLQTVAQQGFTFEILKNACTGTKDFEVVFSKLPQISLSRSPSFAPVCDAGGNDTTRSMQFLEAESAALIGEELRDAAHQARADLDSKIGAQFQSIREVFEAQKEAHAWMEVPQPLQRPQASPYTPEVSDSEESPSPKAKEPSQLQAQSAETLPRIPAQSARSLPIVTPRSQEGLKGGIEEAHQRLEDLLRRLAETAELEHRARQESELWLLGRIHEVRTELREDLLKVVNLVEPDPKADTVKRCFDPISVQDMDKRSDCKSLVTEVPATSTSGPEKWLRVIGGAVASFSLPLAPNSEPAPPQTPLVTIQAETT
jgi:hypothetical protein